MLLTLATVAILAHSVSLVAGEGQRNLELVFSDDRFQFVGVAVSSTGRVFTNYPNWSDDNRYAVVEIVGGTPLPYPNLTMNTWKDGDDGVNKWVCVQAVYIDDEDSLWVVDPASPKMGGVYQSSNKLVKVNLTTNSVQRVYNLTGIVDNQGYINDVQVDTQSQTAYLTNSETGGIVVIDLRTGKARQVLQGHYSVRSDINYLLSINGKPLKKEGGPFVVHSDGIALTPDKKWLYYKPLSDDKLYRIKTSFLRDTTLNSGQLATKVEDVGHQCVSDGMVFDQSGNLYLGDLTTDTVYRLSPQHQLSAFVKDERLIWPDSFAVTKDGLYLYIANSQIHKGPPFNDGTDQRRLPYTIYRTKLN